MGSINLFSMVLALENGRKPKQNLQGILGKNKFCYNRSLKRYREILGNSFWKSLKCLDSKSIWLDSGMGDGTAVLEAAESGKVKAKIMALGYRTPASFRARKKQLLALKVRLYLGKMLEEYSSRKFRNIQLISDVYGPLSYSHNVSKILNNYFSALKVGGSLFFIDSGNSQHPSSCYFINSQGNVCSLPEILKSIEGIKLKVKKCKHGSKIQIIKTKAKINFPDSKMKAVSRSKKESAIQIRVFKIED